MIQIKYGRECGDCTSEYIITTDNVTVEDFINEWITQYPNEWGYFGIKNADAPFFGNPLCEYRCGKLITEPLPKRFLCKKIKSVTGSGGWSRSDFQFEVEDIKRKRFKVWVLDDSVDERSTEK